MTSTNKFKYLFILGVLIAAGFALADSLGYFNPKPYTKVSKGSHAHYVPDNRDPDVSITRFPKQPPGPKEIITPTGQIISEKKWEKQQKASVENTATEKASDSKVRTIEIIGTDQMKFVAKEKGDRVESGSVIKTFNGKQYLMLNQIQAEPGERIRIRLTTVSQLKPKMMSHNWVLLDQGVDPQAFVNAANRKNDYLPSGREDDIIAYTELAADGETVEVVFNTPDEPGSYDYLCSFMSHFAAGMKGQLVVKAKTALNK